MPATTPRPAFRRLVHLSLALATVYLAHVATAAEPERVTGANYPLAAKFSKEFVAQHARLPVGPLVSPKWIGKTDGFWYSVPTSSGMKYWKVDPDKNTKEPLFDAAALAGKLSEQAKKPFDATNLPIANVRVSDDGANMTFTGDEYRYEFEFATLKLTKLGKAPVGPPFPGAGAAGGQLTEEQRRRLEEMRDQVEQFRRDQQQEQQQDQQQERREGTEPPARPAAQNYKAYAPDKKKYVYVYKHNLYLADEGKEDQAVQLTTDGAEEYTFGGGGGLGGLRTRTSEDAQQPPAADRKTAPRAEWSPDS